MSAIPSVRRRRTLTMLAANLVVLAVMGGLLYMGGKALARYQGAKNTSVATTPVPKTPVGMLATVDAEQHLTSVVVFVMKPNGVLGGSVVTVPVSSDVLGGLNGEREPLTEVFTTGGEDALVLGVESVLSVTVDQHMVADPARLEQLLAPVEPVAVDFPLPVETTVDGATTTLYPAGRASLSAQQLVTVLNARGDGQLDLHRRPNLEAVWAGVAKAVGQGRGGAPLAGLPQSFPQVFDQVIGGPMGVRGLPARELPVSEVPEGLDVEELDRAEAVMVFATVAPSNMSAAATGLNFRIEAPPGYEAKVKFAVEALLFLQGNVQQVYLGGPVHPETVVELYDPGYEKDALGAEGLFGSNVVAKSPTTRIEGIDVVIQLGTDFLENTSSPDTLPSTTTTTTVP